MQVCIHSISQQVMKQNSVHDDKFCRIQKKKKQYLIQLCKKSWLISISVKKSAALHNMDIVLQQWLITQLNPKIDKQNSMQCKLSSSQEFYATPLCSCQLVVSVIFSVSRTTNVHRQEGYMPSTQKKGLHTMKHHS